jgi:hypothetical protein
LQEVVAGLPQPLGVFSVTIPATMAISGLAVTISVLSGP